MRLGAFIVGGLAGAAVAMMVRRSDTMSSVFAGLGRRMRRRMKEAGAGAIARTAGVKIGGGLDDVKKWVAQDPNVAKEVEAIFSHNSH